MVDPCAKDKSKRKGYDDNGNPIDPNAKRDKYDADGNKINDKCKRKGKGEDNYDEHGNRIMKKKEAQKKYDKPYKDCKSFGCKMVYNDPRATQKQGKDCKGSVCHNLYTIGSPVNHKQDYKDHQK